MASVENRGRASSCTARGGGASCHVCVKQIGLQHLAYGVSLAGLQVAVGLFAGSKALAVSALYSLRDCLSALILLLGAVSQQAHPPARNHALGRAKLQLLVAGGMSLLILAGVAALCASILHRLLEHRLRAPAEVSLWVAMASVTACWLMAHQGRCLERHAHRSAVGLHMDSLRGHTVAALMVTAAVASARIGLVSADPLVAMIEAAHVVLFAGCSLARVARGLMDVSASTEELATIRAAISQFPAVHSICALSAVRAGPTISVKVTVGLASETILASAERLRGRIRSAIRAVITDAEVLVGFAAVETTRSRSCGLPGAAGVAAESAAEERR